MNGEGALKFAELLREDRRLVILRALEEDAGYSQNESVLQSVLQMFGHKMSRDQVRTELAWLAEQGLITLEHVATVDVATLTTRGEDVACGNITVPGVKRPSPRC